MIAIDEVLDLLMNGDWHRLKEVADKTQLEEFKVELITNFLAEYDFLEFDKKTKKVRLSPKLKLFLTKMHDVDQEGVMRRRSNS